ncbi:MAG: DUF5677 domain-containing protein [Actinomycetota bacterium]|nr:DUF5677 domain-containing protein [Actinomycetota bacterium]
MSEWIKLDRASLPEPHEPLWHELESAKSEAPFMRDSFYLLQEACQWTIAVSCLHPADPTNRNQAILRGLTVRLSKLARLTVRELASKEVFQQLGLSRSVLETIATITYLLQDEGDGNRYDRYVMNSLVAERELLLNIQSNIAERGGESWDIEERMKRSIASTAKAGGVEDVTSLPGRKQIGYPNAEARVRLLGESAYGMYRMGSTEIHGDWTDLYRNHLTYNGSQFACRHDEYEVRPQVPLAIAGLIIRVVGGGLSQITGIPDASDFFGPYFRNLDDRIVRTDGLHERLLSEQ